jgi:hypothetical protein
MAVDREAQKRIVEQAKNSQRILAPREEVTCTSYKSA